MTRLLPLLALAGCVDLSSPYPDRRFYALEAVRPGAAREPAGGATLRIRRFQASRAAEGQEFVSRSGENAWESDFYHGFFTLPASQAGEQTARWLGKSGLFAHVALGGSAAEEAWLLEGHLVALHADRREASKPAAVMELQFALLAMGGEKTELVFQKTYRRDRPAEDGSPAALVRAWNEELASILGALEEDLSRLERPRK
jgi:hypothetical protein